MHNIIWLAAVPAAATVFGLYAWFQGAVAREAAEMGSWSGFDGMHFER